jgi:hypothetical protein
MVMVMVKEASFTDILPKLSKTLIYAFIINGLAVC